jgi:hypothetical protein
LLRKQLRGLAYPVLIAATTGALVGGAGLAATALGYDSVLAGLTWAMTWRKVQMFSSVAAIGVTQALVAVRKRARPMAGVGSEPRGE